MGPFVIKAIIQNKKAAVCPAYQLVTQGGKTSKKVITSDRLKN